MAEAPAASAADRRAEPFVDRVVAFLDASFETKQALLTDDALWDKIRPAMNVKDDALFKQLRDDYRAGIVTHYIASDMGPAKQAFELMAQFGGKDVVRHRLVQRIVAAYGEHAERESER